MYILPRPQSVTWKDGGFRLRYNTGIVIDTEIPEEENGYVYDYAKLLQEEVKEVLGFVLPIRRERARFGGGDIILSCADVDNPIREAYTVRISRSEVIVTGTASVGILYGVQTLRQIIRQAGACLPCVQILDAPKIEERGLSYDVTRGRVPTLAELKRQADICSFYKLNQLQLYVEHTYLFRDFSEMWRYNTPLVAEDILELDAYCKKLHVELVPQLASFGHLYEVLQTKTYAHLCELENWTDKPYSLIERMEHHTVDVSNEESFQMVCGRISEFMALFSSKYFNICADETFDLCKGRSRELGEKKGVRRAYVEFLKKLCEFVLEMGKIPMFWGDVLIEQPELLEELPEQGICLNWEYAPNVTENNVKKLSEAGVKNLYLCPGVQSWNHMINRHRDAYQNISKMCANAHKYHVRGILNTEWGDLGHVAHPEFSTIGQIYGAAFSWSDVIDGEAEINKAISIIQYGDKSGELVSLFAELADTECVNWWHAVQMKERGMDRVVWVDAEGTAEEITEKVKAQLEKNEAYIEKLYEKLSDLSVTMKSDVGAYILMGEGQRLLSMSGLVLYEKSQGKVISYDGEELAVQLEYWVQDYCKLWRSVAKESELFRVVEVISWYADRLREL